MGQLPAAGANHLTNAHLLGPFGASCCGQVDNIDTGEHEDKYGYDGKDVDIGDAAGLEAVQLRPEIDVAELFQRQAIMHLQTQHLLAVVPDHPGRETSL